MRRKEKGLERESRLGKDEERRCGLFWDEKIKKDRRQLLRRVRDAVGEEVTMRKVLTVEERKDALDDSLVTTPSPFEGPSLSPYAQKNTSVKRPKPV